MLRTGFVPLFFDDYSNAKERVCNLDADHMMDYMDAVDECRRQQLALEEQGGDILNKSTSKIKSLNGNLANKKYSMKCNCCHKPCLCNAYMSIRDSSYKF